MKYKRLFVSLFICSIIALNMCPFFCTYSYADTVTDNWQNVTTNEQLVEAFKYYCKSRDLTIDGSIADGVTQFTTKTFNGLCNTLGIDVTALQAHLKYETDGNLGLRFLFDSTGITAYNRIFAQFLQDNDLQVGDSANEQNNTLYNGKLVTINDVSCLVYVLSNSSINANDVAYPSEYFIQRGTYFLTGSTIKSLYDGGSRTISNLDGGNIGINKTSSGGYQLNGYTIYGTLGNGTNVDGGTVIYYVTNGDYFSYGCYRRYSINETAFLLNRINIPNNDVQQTNIYLTTNNTVINNNTYEGDTIINNNGTPGGGNNDDDDWNPTTPTVPDYNGGGGSNNTINWPSIDIPDFNINFSLGNITEKFPFSIPFDLIALLTVLDGEPKAPDLDITIPLIVTDWHFEADFSQFDDLAQLIRAFEFIGFCIYLLYFTVGLVKG